MWRKWWMMCAVVLLAGCGGGGGQTDTDDGRHHLGNGMSVVVRDVVIDGQQVAVDLEYFNDTDAVIDKTIAYDAFLFTADGVEVDPGLNDDELESVPKAVPPQSSVHGWKVYELPSGDSPDTLLVYGEIGDDPVVVDL